MCKLMVVMYYVMLLRNGHCLENCKWDLQIFRKLQDQAVYCTNNTYLSGLCNFSPDGYVISEQCCNLCKLN